MKQVRAVNLDLEIGSCGREDKRKFKGVEKHKSSIFTVPLFHEFLSPVLVYNHTLSVISFTPERCDRSCTMDLEPGRCRRTDGRKWRCNKSVVPNQKYCERHMHRGRQCSRKHVEATGSVSKLGSKLSSNNRASMISYVASVMNTRIPVYDKGNSNLTKQGCSYSNEDRAALLAADKEVKKNAYVDCATVCLGVATIDRDASKGVGHAEDKKSGFENVTSTKISRRKQCVTRNNYIGFMSPMLDSSPMSVLHCAAGKLSLSLRSKTVPETENLRCRRTDGKKWQCRQDAVPGQKYCEVHMHRGAKRFVPNPESAVRNDAPGPATTSKHLDNGINLNAVPASPQCDNSSSSPSDATTITDENISFCQSTSL